MCHCTALDESVALDHSGNSGKILLSVQLAGALMDAALQRSGYAAGRKMKMSR